MLYRRLCRGVADRGILVPYDSDIYSYIDNMNEAWFASIFYYNEEQKEVFERTGSISGITDVITNRLVFDFDEEKDLEFAQTETQHVCKRLIDQGISEASIQIYFSGQKGFSVEVETNQWFTPDEFKDLTRFFAAGLTTYDSVVANPSRIFRVPGTKHQTSGLYKTALLLSQLELLSWKAIITLAEQKHNLLNTTLAEGSQLRSLLKAKSEITKDNVAVEDIDFEAKIKGWSNCKWAILQGYEVKNGDRHNKLLAVVATSKALNYTQELAYYNAKHAMEKGVARYGGDGIAKKELWQLTESVYSPQWKGGTFSCKDGKSPWLTELCQSLGKHECADEKENIFIEMSDLSSTFERFATEIDQNKIKTGLASLDDTVTLCTSTLVGLLGNPGSGKTSISLNILNHCSKSDINSIFFSMDMGVPLVFLKLVQKHFKLPHEEAFYLYKHEPKKSAEISALIKEEYKNVKFSFKAGLEVQDIRNSIIKQQETTGAKTKLVVIDYLECISGPYSDATANTAIIANQLKDVANETETCILLLLQTQKHSSAPDEPLLSMKNIKGSSVIEQASSVILTLWREGYNPKYSEYDKFISLATVKDRLSSLWQDDFHWTGLTGYVRELLDVEREELKKLRDRKKLDKEKDKQTNGW